MEFATCTAVTCISTGAVVKICSIVAGMWALGYGIGQAVQWTRRLRDAA
jgi:hypothetical protein